MSKKPWIRYDGFMSMAQGVTQLPEKIPFSVMIKDGFAVLIMQRKHKRILKKIVKSEKKNGSDIEYYEDKNIVVERHPNKTTQEIAKKIGGEMKRAGGELYEVQ